MAKPLNLNTASEQDNKVHESFGERLERNSFWKGRNKKARYYRGVCCPRPRPALLIQVPQRAWDGPKAISKISEIDENRYVRTLWAISICTEQGLN